MKTRNKLRNIILSLLLVTTIFTGLFTTQVSANTNSVDVTLHKRQYAEMPNPKIPNTGAEMDFGGTPLEGAEFTVYDVTDKYHAEMKLQGATQASVNTIIQGLYTPFAPENSVGVSKTTDVDGLAKFENLVVRETDGEKRFKVYVFVETKTPSSISVTEKSAPMVIAMPIYKMDDTGKHTDVLLPHVHLYPKNVTVEDQKEFKNAGIFDSIVVNEKKHFNVPTGATLEFEVTLNIPADIAKNTEYSLTDIPTAGLEYIDKSINVGNLKLGTDYTITPSGGGFIINFTIGEKAIALNALAGKPLIVTYNMKLTAEVTPDSLYENKAVVSVNTTPRDEMKTGPEDPKFYTGGHKFIKKDAQTNNVLAGAKFKVGNAAGTQFAEFTTNSKGEHAFVKWTTEALATEIASNEKGELFVIGLLKGDYILKETAAPSEKYVLIVGDIAFTVKDGYATQTVQTILNHAKGLLPSTGGNGIYGFLVVGGLMMAGSLIWFKRSNRKETDF